MLQPKKTKFRRQQKGRQKGNAQRGNQLAFGSFGIKALETKWITGRQIEAARIAVTRYMQRQGQIWIRIFPDKPSRHCLSVSILGSPSTRANMIAPNVSCICVCLYNWFNITCGLASLFSSTTTLVFSFLSDSSLTSLLCLLDMVMMLLLFFVYFRSFLLFRLRLSL